MSETLLEVRDLHAGAGEKEIICGLDLTIRAGETHVIMGPNGAGKSTLAGIIMGHPSYEVREGSIEFEGEDISEEGTDERARRGIFLSFQAPEEVEGVTVEHFLKSAKEAITGEQQSAWNFHKGLEKTMDKLDFNHDYAARYLNVGFSGGEKKKNEIFQMLVLEPKLAMLDETDSGLDVDAVKTVSQGIHEFKNENNALLIITHNAALLESLETDFVHILVDGKIVKTGDASLIDEVNTRGFAQLLKEA